MDILRQLLCGNLVKLPPRCGLRFSIRAREGVEVATTNGLVLGGWAWVGVGRRVGRRLYYTRTPISEFSTAITCHFKLQNKAKAPSRVSEVFSVVFCVVKVEAIKTTKNLSGSEIHARKFFNKKMVLYH